MTAQYNYLSSNCGLKVSNICLGTLTFGEGFPLPSDLTADEDLSYSILDRYVQLGGNFVDTADIYGTNGSIERIVGNWLQRQVREDIIIATKCRYNINNLNSQNGQGLSRRHIISALEKSLERLQTPFIDLYQLHGWDLGTPVEESLRTVEDLVRSGKVRYPGVSNLTGWQLQKMIDLQKHMGLNPFVTLQQQYSLVERNSEREAIQVCHNEGLGLLPWSPLKGGLLSGKYRPGQNNVPGSRLDWAAEDLSTRCTDISPDMQTYFNNSKFIDLLRSVDKIAQAQKRSFVQVALKWLLQKPSVTSVVIGVRSLDQLEENMKAGEEWTLTQDQMEELNKLSLVDSLYPYGGTLAPINQIRVRTKPVWL